MTSGQRTGLESSPACVTNDTKITVFAMHLQLFKVLSITVIRDKQGRKK